MSRPDHYLAIDATNPRHAKSALADLRDGLSQWRLALALARLDLRNRYRGSVLGEFLDVPIHGYSAGMSIRLAFAMATAVQPKVLLMDEWFSAGDASFMAKAEMRLEELVTATEILVIATHDMTVVKRWCKRIIRLGSGRILADGPVMGF